MINLWPLRSLPKTRGWNDITFGENELLEVILLGLLWLNYNILYHLSPVCSIRAFAKELDLSFWKLWDENLWSLPNWNQYWENRKKIQKLRCWDDTKNGIHYFLRASWRRRLSKHEPDDTVWWSYTPLSAVSSQNAPQSGSTLKNINEGRRQGCVGDG